MTKDEQIAFLNGRIEELEKQIAQLRLDLLSQRTFPKWYTADPYQNPPIYEPRPPAHTILCGVINNGAPMPLEVRGCW